MILDDENILIEGIKNDINWPSLIEKQFIEYSKHTCYDSYVSSLKELIKFLNNNCKIANGEWRATNTNRIIFTSNTMHDDLLCFEYVLAPTFNHLNITISYRRDALDRYNIDDEYLQNILHLLATQPGYELVNETPYWKLYSKFC